MAATVVVVAIPEVEVMTTTGRVTVVVIVWSTSVKLVTVKLSTTEIVEETVVTVVVRSVSVTASAVTVGVVKMVSVAPLTVV